MKLVFYSGGQDPSNHVLHQALVALAGKKKKKRITYFAFCSENANLFFHRFVRRYRGHGASEFRCLVLDEPQTEADIKKAFQTDIIYICGGNTFFILKHLKRLKLLGRLRKFAKEGGVLAGLSAGAIIMTPNVKLAGYPVFDADENDVKLTDLSALSLVDFEFFPHYGNSQRLNRALEKYSLRVKNPIYACADGNGIVIDDGRFQATGTVYVFHRGRRFRL